MPNAKAALWPHNVERLKHYPYLLYIFPPRAPQPLIRTDWLEKAGMEAPETIEEFEQLLIAIRDGDFDGDGQANTLGMTGYVNTNELDSAFNQAFGVSSTWMKDDSGQWVHSRITPQERDKIAWYAKLAAEGLFDKEYVTNTFDVKEEKFYTGRAGVIFASSPEVADTPGMDQARPVAEATDTAAAAPSLTAPPDTAQPTVSTDATATDGAPNQDPDRYHARRELSRPPKALSPIDIVFPPGVPTPGRHKAVLAVYIDELGHVRKVRTEGEALPLAFEDAARNALEPESAERTKLERDLKKARDDAESRSGYVVFGWHAPANEKGWPTSGGPARLR